MAPMTKPTIKITYPAPLRETVAQTKRGRTTTIVAKTLTVNAWPGSHGLYVTVEGVVRRKDGSLGMSYRTLGYLEVTRTWDEDAGHISQLPAWSRPLIDEARALIQLAGVV